MARKETVSISDYEAKRQANIAERNALLKKLAVDAASSGLATKPSSKPSTNGTKTHKKRAPVKKVKEELVPRRTSSRLAGLTADSEVAKRKADDEYEAMQEAARAKRQRVSDDLNLSDVVVAGKEWDRSENFLVDYVSRGAKPYERTFGESEVKETSDKELLALREKMSGLELYEGFEPNQIKITPERIYSLGFHPHPEKPLVFAGDKLGNLGVFDASQKTSSSRKFSPSKPIKSSSPSIKDEDDSDSDSESSLPAISSFHLHTRTISSFAFSPANPSHLYTTSYDSTLRLLDLTASQSTQIHAPSSPSDDLPLSALDIDPLSPSTIYFSRLDGHVGRLDTRTPTHHPIETWALSEKKIGGFSLHPSAPHLLATASLDRFLKVWDVRKIRGAASTSWRLPHLVAEHESRLSVSHASFNSAGQIATTSYDDTIKIHSLPPSSSLPAGSSLPDAQFAPSAIIKHNNQTGRWVTILRAQWQRAPRDNVQRFVVGNMNRFVDVYTADGQQLAQLGGEGITAVPAVAMFHPENDWIAAGTASGKICLWM
ncbi:hypothetical protein MMC20_007277 [Loxospora ochrophaea]|nr:hypothetical protein [Loxospora ochrophaea]